MFRPDQEFRWPQWMGPCTTLLVNRPLSRTSCPRLAVGQLPLVQRRWSFRTRTGVRLGSRITTIASMAAPAAVPSANAKTGSARNRATPEIASTSATRNRSPFRADCIADISLIIPASELFVSTDMIEIENVSRQCAQIGNFCVFTLRLEQSARLERTGSCASRHRARQRETAVIRRAPDRSWRLPKGAWR